MSLCLALVLAGVAYRIAKRQGLRWPVLAFMFVLGQPLVFLHSFTTLTELPFAFLLALAFWAYCARQWFWMTVAAAMLPLARPEGFLFVGLAGIALIVHRRWWWIVMLPIPLVAWDWAGWEVFGRPAYHSALAAWLPEGLQWVLWLKHEWPYAEQSAYMRGPLLHFVILLPAIVGPVVFPAVLVGIGDCLSRGVGWAKSHIVRCRVLIAVIPLTVLAAHSLLYWLGKMASNGEPRYMLVVGVFWALLAAYGWEWVFERLRWRHAVLGAGVAALLPVVVQFFYPVLPLKLSSEWESVGRAAVWYQTSGIAAAYPRLLTSHPAFYYFLDVDPGDKSRVLEWDKQTVAKCPPGTLLVWDHTYGMFNSDRNRIVSVAEIERAGWIEDPEAELQFGARGDQWRVFHSPVSMLPKRGSPTRGH